MKHFDVIVVGAGPAGMTAATLAAESGRRVAVLDDNPAAGGQIWRAGTEATLYSYEFRPPLSATATVLKEHA